MKKDKKSGAEIAPPADAPVRARRAPVPQPHGGALIPGAGGGRENGQLGGRPPSELRRRLRDAADRRIEVLEEIADGIVKIPVVGACEKCGHQHSAEKMGITDIVKAAVSANDRKAAIEVMLRFGIGTNDEISVVSPDVQSRLDMQAARFVAELPPEMLAIVKRIADEVWQ